MLPFVFNSPHENWRAEKGGLQIVSVLWTANQTAIGAYGFTYDGESRMATGTISGAATTYSYDGDGRRALITTPAGGFVTSWNSSAQ